MFALAFAIAVAATPAPSSPPVTADTEILGIDAPDEFQIGSHQKNSTTELTEMVVPPETVETWRNRMITLVLLRDGVSRIGADTFHDDWMKRMVAACPGIVVKTKVGTVDGLHAIEDEMACPKNPETGLPENLTAVTIQGRVNILMAQVAYRHAPTKEDKALAEHVMRSLKVCNQPTLSACTARKATGFVVAGR